MKIPALLTVLLLLSGCTDADWNGAVSGTWLDAPKPEAADAAPDAAPAPMPVAAAQNDPGFCQAVAKQDANGNDFDAPTRSRVYARSYAQCLTMLGSTAR